MIDRSGDDCIRLVHDRPVHDMARNAGDDGRDDDWDQDYDGGLLVEEEKPKLQPPKQYKVLVINDDYTPMEFVVQVLMMFFAMDHAKATRVMMSVHTKGKGICGTYSHEIAETKVDQVNEYSRMNQHPLMCTMEEV
jgi:ATP-dependent Clp protease adaptor protein ClpS